MPKFRVIEEFAQATVRIVRVVEAETREEAEEGVGDRGYAHRLIEDEDDEVGGVLVDLGGEACTVTDETKLLDAPAGLPVKPT